MGMLYGLNVIIFFMMVCIIIHCIFCSAMVNQLVGSSSGSCMNGILACLIAKEFLWFIS